MNHVSIIGRLAAAPELKKTLNGYSVTSFTVAVTRPGTRGENEVADWIDCVVWRKTAEFVCKYFDKGSPIVIQGSLQTRFWEDKDGGKHKATEVICGGVEFVPRSKSSSDAAVETLAGAAEVFADDEDIPF